MSEPVVPGPPIPMGRLAPIDNIDDAARNIDQIVDWSIKAQSNIGYFAVLYKRVTLAIHEAINEGVFENGARMAALDVAFARRYFNALNTYFYPADIRPSTRV